MRRLILLLSLLASTSFAAAPAEDGWRLERGVDPPSYAVVVPHSTNLNLDSIVLMCEQADDARVLQLQLYLTNEGPLIPNGQDARSLKQQARAEITIDQQIFPASIAFADDYVVVFDESEGPYPALSARLLDAMTTGKIMLLRLDLIIEPAGKAPAFDGEATIDLQAGAGGAGVAAVRRCLAPSRAPHVAHARP